MPVILVVDDDEIIGRIFDIALSAFSGDVHYCNRPIEAIELCKRIKPDIIFVDLHMPGMDGFEFVSKVKALGVDSYITFISAETDTGTVRKMIDAGDFGLIRKPVSIDDLREKLLTARIILKLDKKLK